MATTLALDHNLVGADQYDDSYITYRYAQNFATGNGLVFNSYERINSASSFLYTMVLAGAYRVGVHDLELFASLFGLAMGCVVVAVTFLMAREATGRQSGALVFTLPLCVAGSIGGWAVSGMETIFFTALLVTFLHAYLFVRVSKPAAFALLGLVVLCRYEGVLLLALVAAREGLAAWAGGKRRDVAWLVLLAVAPLAALLGFNLAYYGDAVPHSFHFKRVAVYYSPGIVNQIVGLGRFWFGYYLAYVVLAVVAMSRAIRSGRAVRGGEVPPLSFLAAYVALSFATFVVSPSSDMQRYTVHVLPVLAILALAGAIQLSRRPSPRRIRRMAAVVVMLMLFGGAISNGVGTAQQLDAVSEQQAARRQLADWLTRNTRPGDMIASADLGQIAYRLAGRDFVDVFGLTSRGFVELSQTRADQMPVLFAQRRPSYIADTASRAPEAAGARGEARLLTSTEAILAKPSRAFRNVAADPRAGGHPPYVRTPVLSIRAAGYDFMIVKLDWSRQE